MKGMRKITVTVPKDDLNTLQAQTGEGVTEVVRMALKTIAGLQREKTARSPEA